MKSGGIKVVGPAKRGDALKEQTGGFKKGKEAYSTKFGGKNAGMKKSS